MKSYSFAKSNILIKLILKPEKDISVYHFLGTHDDYKVFVSSIRTPMLIQGRLERTETNLNGRYFKWEVT